MIICFSSENIKRALNEKTFCTIAPIKIKQKIGFIGDGNMSKALCNSIENKGLINYSQVYVSSPYVKNLDVWKQLGANVTTNNNEVAQKSDIIFLAVKPHMLNVVLDKLIQDSKINTISNKLFVSILAGITLKELEEVISTLLLIPNDTHERELILENAKLSRFKSYKSNAQHPNGSGCRLHRLLSRPKRD
jgi:hypothetical protein